MDTRTGVILTQLFAAITSSVVIVFRTYFAFRLVKTAVRTEKQTGISKKTRFVHFIFWYFILAPALSFLLSSILYTQSLRPFFSILSMILFIFLNSTLFLLFDKWYFDFKFKGIPSLIIFIAQILLSWQFFYIYLGYYDISEIQRFINLVLSYIGGSLYSVTVLFLIIKIISEQKKGKIGPISGKYIAWGLLFLYVISLLFRLIYTIPFMIEWYLDVILMNIVNSTVGLIGTILFFIGLEKDMDISTR